VAACEFALTHAARVRSLVMVDVAAKVAVEATAQMRSFIRDFPGAERVADVVAMAMAVSPKSDPERLDYRMRTLLRRAHDGRLVWKRDDAHVNIDRITEHLANFEPRVGQVAAPFLLVRGGRSRIVTPKAAADFTNRFANGRWVEIADAGHNVQEDNPRDLAAALAAFWLDAASMGASARKSMSTGKFAAPPDRAAAS
jgi:pimeloyl-ACP methyl ester carboxylesterase